MNNVSKDWVPDVNAFAEMSNGLIFRRGFEKYRQDLINTFKYVDFDGHNMEKMLIMVGACDLLYTYSKLDAFICRGDLTTVSYTKGFLSEDEENRWCITLQFFGMNTSYEVSYTLINGIIVSVGRYQK